MAITETIPYNFDDIYEYIEQKFEEEGYDTEEGSNTMQLVTAMSYLVSMLNANTAANINETILPLARKRSVALNDARVLGYEVSHVQSYQYSLTLEFSNAGTYRINKYDSFSTGDHTYYYMGDTTDSFTVSEGETVTKTITVKEGTLNKYSSDESLSLTIESQYNANTKTWAAQEYIDVPYTDVEENGIEMFLTYYDESGNYYEMEEWSRTTQFMIEADTSLNKEFVRLDLIDYGMPRLYFKIGDIGKDMRIGTLVYLNVLQSSGEDGKMTETPTPDSLDCEVTSYTLSVQGASEETLESIQTNAPLFNNTANRVITINDYIAFCNRQTSVETSVIWDGGDEYPERPGYIWFTFTPATITRNISNTGEGYEWTLDNPYDNVNWYIEDDEITEVFNVLDDYKIPTLEFLHRQPIYMDFEYTINIPRYVVQTSEADINEGVFNVINDYFTGDDSTTNDPVESFRFEYFQSNLNKRIDSQLTDNMGFNISLKTTIPLNERLIINETFGGSDVNEIRFHLGVPFEGLYDSNGDVIFDNIPSINTTDFDGSNDLSVSESSSTYSSAGEYTSYNILLGSNIVGEYRVYDETISDIEVILYITSDDGYTTGISSSVISDDGTLINVEYPNSNIPMKRNTIARLKTVTFE